MYRYCCYCKKFMGQKAPLLNTAKTHGICDECFHKLEQEVKARKVRNSVRLTNAEWLESRGESKEDYQ